MRTNHQEKKILIVEDEAPLSQLLEDTFSREGFKTFEAKNGKEGLEIVFREHPDLILLDIIMPEMDGLTMLKKLQKDKRSKDTPVIILTNLSDAEKVAIAIEGGVYEYLIKSDWKLGDLVNKVKTKLGV